MLKTAFAGALGLASAHAYSFPGVPEILHRMFDEGKTDTDANREATQKAISEQIARISNQKNSLFELSTPQPGKMIAIKYFSIGGKFFRSRHV